jgi:hypothetical protein
MKISPTSLGARPGDIVHVRSKTLYGRLIRRCLVVATGDARVEVTISEPNKTISPPVHVEVPLR